MENYVTRFRAPTQSLRNIETDVDHFGLHKTLVISILQRTAVLLSDESRRVATLKEMGPSSRVDRQRELGFGDRVLFFGGGGYLEVSLGHEYEPKVSMIMVTLEVGTEETSVCE